jgi:hypothetical protein
MGVVPDPCPVADGGVELDYGGLMDEDVWQGQLGAACDVTCSAKAQ